MRKNECGEGDGLYGMDVADKRDKEQKNTLKKRAVDTCTVGPRMENLGSIAKLLREACLPSAELPLDTCGLCHEK